MKLRQPKTISATTAQLIFAIIFIIFGFIGKQILPNSLTTIFSRTKLALGTLLFSALAFAVVGLIFFGWLTDEMTEGDTLGFDDAVRSFVHQYATPALTSLMQIASFLGSTVFLTCFGIGVFILFWLRKRRRAATFFAITMAGSTVLLVTLKTVFHRARPEPFFETVLPASYSFPSGHALSSFCFYGVLAAIITARVKRRFFKAIIWTCAVLLIALIGISRVYLGVHYPSDVLAGYTTAFVWTVAVAIADRLLRQRKSIDKTRQQN